MRTPLRLAFLLGSLVALAHGCGCASVIGTAFKREPYAGTQLDVAVLSSAPRAKNAGEVLLTGAALVDLPASLVADTVLLPVTLSGTD